MKNIFISLLILMILGCKKNVPQNNITKINMQTEIKNMDENDTTIMFTEYTNCYYCGKQMPSSYCFYMYSWIDEFRFALPYSVCEDCSWRIAKEAIRKNPKIAEMATRNFSDCKRLKAEIIYDMIKEDKSLNYLLEPINKEINNENCNDVNVVSFLDDSTRHQ